MNTERPTRTAFARFTLIAVKCVILPITLQAFTAKAQSFPTEVAVNPRATYLLTYHDPAEDAVPINLAALGVIPGDLLRLRTLGNYDNGGGIQGSVTTGVFSSNSVLLAQDVANRVPGAISAGTPFATLPTYTGSFATDIPQDFFISGLAGNISIHVPAGAAYLFISAVDSKFSDNFDITTNHFRLQIDRGNETFLTATAISSGAVRISWNTDSNQQYQVQAAPMASVGWTNTGAPILGTGTTLSRTNSTIDEESGYYRVIRVP
jgi:hypothetical protein